MKCTTTAGRFQCEHDADHDGDCEATKPSPFPVIGPYVEVASSRAYLRGRLDASVGGVLDALGIVLNIRRNQGENDRFYRERIWKESDHG